MMNSYDASSASANRHRKSRRAATAAAMGVAVALGAGTLMPSVALAEEQQDAFQPQTADAPDQQLAPTAQGEGSSLAQPSGETGAVKTSSSDSGSWEQAGLYRLTIRYVDAAGNEIAPAYRSVLSSGDCYDVASPEVGGYTLADSSQAQVSGTVSGDARDIELSVTYKSSEAIYRVIHERQVERGGKRYYVAETEDLTAPIGSTATASPKSYDGYECVTPESERSCTVSMDGKATIVIRYDYTIRKVGIYFETNGSYVASVFGNSGEAYGSPEKPTRQGYSFVGWDIDGDGAVDALPATLPDDTIVARAVWKPARTTYLVRYWGELEGGTGAGEPSYGLLETRTIVGVTGELTTSPDRLSTSTSTSKYCHYNYLRESAPTVIAADGSTVIDVWYEFKTVTFEVGARSAKSSADSPVVSLGSFTLKFGRRYENPSPDEAIQSYKAAGGKGEFFSWRFHKNQDSISGLNPVGWIDLRGASFDSYFTWGSDGTLHACLSALFDTRRMYDGYAFDMFMQADGSYADSPDVYHDVGPENSRRWVNSVEKNGYRLCEYRRSKNVWDGNDRSTIEWDRWLRVSKSSGKYSVSYRADLRNVVQIKWERISYTVGFYSQGGLVSEQTGRWGATLDVDGISLVAPDGMVFAGWYDNPECSGSPVTVTEIPIGGVNLYAKWIRPDVTISFDSAGGTSVGSQTIGWGGTVARPADPTREGFEFGGWYYAGSDGSGLALFPFDLALQGDTHVVAAWRSLSKDTTYRIEHVSADGRVLETEYGVGTVGQTLTAKSLGAHDYRRSGLGFCDAAARTIDLAEDGLTNVIRFTYFGVRPNHYVIRYVDAATDEEIGSHEFDSFEVLEDATAEAIPGWTVRNGGTGWLSCSGDGSTAMLTFYYDRVAPAPGEKDPEGSETGGEKPGNATDEGRETSGDIVQAVARRSDGSAKLPRTGDSSLLSALVACLAGFGALVAGLFSQTRGDE